MFYSKRLVALLIFAFLFFAVLAAGNITPIVSIVSFCFTVILAFLIMAALTGTYTCIFEDANSGRNDHFADAFIPLIQNLKEEVHIEILLSNPEAKIDHEGLRKLIADRNITVAITPHRKYAHFIVVDGEHIRHEAKHSLKVAGRKALIRYSTIFLARKHAERFDNLKEISEVVIWN